MGAADKPVILLRSFGGFPALGGPRHKVLSLGVASVTFSRVLTLQLELALHFHLFDVFQVKSTSWDVSFTWLSIEVALTLLLLGG